VRRRAIVALPLLAAGCGLSERPYEERRQWPLDIPSPATLPPRRGGRVLMVRAIRAGPGLDQRGLQSVQPDGSVRTAFYEEWAVAPALGVEAALARWLAASGRFAAVVAQGSRLAADLTLEGELDALCTEPARGVGRAALSATALRTGEGNATILFGRSFAADAPLAGADPPAQVAAMRAALAAIFGQIESAFAVT
jgi:ABC-type uncharacterized transport system auxiliary subunit